MTSLVNRVLSFLKDQNLICQSDRVSVAVSGGVDSVALLLILQQLTRKLLFELSVIHVNHHTRGVESDEDEDFTRALAKSLDIEFFCYHAENLTEKSSEEKMRKERYRIFVEHCQKYKCKIATAHHLDDQFETFLMRLVKGSGLRGLKAIPAAREYFIRPLLNIKKVELVDYCKTHGIKFRYDKSNDSLANLRNKIRLKLTPVFHEIFDEDILAGFNASLQKLTRSYNEFEKESLKLFDKVSEINQNKIIILIKDYNSFTYLQRHRFIEYCFNKLNNVSSVIDSFWIEKIDKLTTESQTGTSCQIKSDFWVARNREQLIFYKQLIRESSKKLYPNSTVTFNHFEIGIESVEPAEVFFSQTKTKEFISGDDFSFPLTVRSWREGDFFYPLGMNQKQKISDYFINNKIDIVNKNLIPILFYQTEVVWIVGHRIDNRYAWNKKCKKTFKLFVRKVLN